MGKFSNGIWGNFYGKIGNVIGSQWRGIDYLRSLPRINKNRVPSQAQIEQQARFALMTGFLNLIRPVLEIGFRNQAIGATAYNVALSENIKNAITGIYPEFGIDYSMVSLSRGLLPSGLNPAAEAEAGLNVGFSWANNAGKGKAKDTDAVVALIFCPELNEFEYSVAQATRADGALSVTVPADFGGKEVETYLFWVPQTGKEMSSTVYTGKLTITD